LTLCPPKAKGDCKEDKGFVRETHAERLIVVRKKESRGGASRFIWGTKRGEKASNHRPNALTNRERNGLREQTGKDGVLNRVACAIKRIKRVPENYKRKGTRLKEKAPMRGRGQLRRRSLGTSDYCLGG